MILQNCRKLLTNPGPNDYNIALYLVDMSGQSSGIGQGSQIFCSRSALRILVGTGTNAVTENDYTLTMIDTNVLNPLSNTAKNGGNVNNYTRLSTVSTTFNNISSSSVTVTELGIAYQPGTTSGSVTNWTRILFTRELLDTPVTIAPGESYTFTAVIDIK